MKIKICPLEPEYKFTSHCTIERCKFYTPATKNRCMSLDTTFAGNDKTITDSELVLYKRPDVSVKEMSAMRKQYLAAAHSIIAFHHLIENIRNNECPSRGFNMAMAKSFPSQVRQLCRKVLISGTYNIPYLRCEPWMLSFIFDNEYVQKSLHGVEKFSLTNLFGLSNREIKLLTTSIKKARK